MFSASSTFVPSLFGALRSPGWCLRPLAAGVGLAFTTTLAFAQPNNLSGTWRINGNGYPGDLVISQAVSGGRIPTGGRIQGSMYNDSIVGYFSTGERTMVLVRYSPAGTTMQAFVGQVNALGTRWEGRFYGLDTSWSGASATRNAWSFVATRGTSSTPATPPALIPTISPVAIADSFNFYNRPAEFGKAWPGALNITSGSLSSPTSGQIAGNLYGDQIVGTYANGTIAFLRLTNQQPTQVYVGEDYASELVSWRLDGSFYPLTEVEGASPMRMTYDWLAIVPACETRPCQ